jgi:hypothetical protein
MPRYSPMSRIRADVEFRTLYINAGTDSLPIVNLGLTSMKRLILISAIAMAATSAHAQLSSEPPPGALPAGQSVLVDDGTCGPGKIKKVTGGSDTWIGTGQHIKGGSARKRTCIKKKL